MMTRADRRCSARAGSSATGWWRCCTSRGAEVVPVVRRRSRPALAGRFDLPVADRRRARQRRAAGCVRRLRHVWSSPSPATRATIVDSVEPVVPRRRGRGSCAGIVYLSTRRSTGSRRRRGTDETTPTVRSPAARLQQRQGPCRAGARRVLRDGGSAEIVVLRPGIVYGPRSQWTGGLADHVLTGEAALVDGGHGICNADLRRQRGARHPARPHRRASPTGRRSSSVIARRSPGATSTGRSRSPRTRHRLRAHAVLRRRQWTRAVAGTPARPPRRRALLPRPVRAGLMAAYLRLRPAARFARQPSGRG